MQPAVDVDCFSFFPEKDVIIFSSPFLWMSTLRQTKTFYRGFEKHTRSNLNGQGFTLERVFDDTLSFFSSDNCLNDQFFQFVPPRPLPLCPNYYCFTIASLFSISIGFWACLSRMFIIFACMHMKDLPNEKLWLHDFQLRLQHLFKVGKYV